LLNFSVKAPEQTIKRFTVFLFDFYQLNHLFLKDGLNTKVTIIYFCVLVKQVNLRNTKFYERTNKTKSPGKTGLRKFVHIRTS
jgi:2-phosphoglycerate kinase